MSFFTLSGRLSPNYTCYSVPQNKISFEKGGVRGILKKWEYSCLLRGAGFFHTLRLFLADTSSISRDDWYKKMRIVLATCIDYVLALVYGCRMSIRVSLFGVRIDIASLHYDP